MIKVPQRDEVWKRKEDGYLARITSSHTFVHFLDNTNGCFDFEEMNNFQLIDDFIKDWEYVGNGKPLEVLFEVQND